MDDPTESYVTVAGERWTQIKKIVDQALDLTTAERKTFVDKSCQSDELLRAEVESLLSFDNDSFLESPVGTLRGPLDIPQLAIGATLGPYEIQSLIGSGGMGEVYRAIDTRLQRLVAVKVLPQNVASSQQLRQRLEREAKAISQLNHPHICTLHDVGSQNNIDYLVMEYIAGETLTATLRNGPLAVETALQYATQIASGLDRAHRAGIVHRDLKPDNVMLTRAGVKLLDFGIAKRVQADTSPDSVTESVENAPSSLSAATGATTRQGALLGTVPYMSPEQAAGQTIDHLSDQFSLGTVLYEMLSGQRPFEGASPDSTLQQILHATPTPLCNLRPEVDEALEGIVERCLQKSQAERFKSTRDLHQALVDYQDTSSDGFRFKRRTVLASLLSVALVAGVSAWYWLRDDIVRWIERDTLAAAEKFIEAGQLNDAYHLISPVQDKVPNDPVVYKMLERFTIPITVATDPPGAQVQVQGYVADHDRWLSLGTTPLQGVRIPYALMRWRIGKPGFETFEGAPFGRRPFAVLAQGMTLEPAGSRPSGMVRIPGGPYKRVGFPPVELDAYWLDRHEVSNREFKAFVDAGGYQQPKYWREATAAADLSPDETLIDQLLDDTGQPGPAGWRHGTFEKTQANFPVGGVSWFEAAAYCQFVGKQLPTLFHWSAASVQDELSDIVGESNFAGQGPAEIGSHRGLSDFGNFDLAGNLREWVWNQANFGRYILGGSWSDPEDTFNLVAVARPPQSRDANNGFRCARYDKPVEPALLGRFIHDFDRPQIESVSDEVYAVYRRMYAYDRIELQPSLVAVDDSSPHWRKETVSFAAAYGGERMLAHVFLPRNATPPFQTVLWVPGNDALLVSPGAALATQYLYDFVPGTGRALVYPVYRGTYERHIPFSFAPNEWRDLIIAWSKDLSRTVDYLEQRDDIDTDKLGYFGFSAGALYGPIFTAIDDRFKASVLLAGGIAGGFEPEVSPASFATHSSVPTLMINGKDDFLNPLKTSQLALLERLGAAKRDKRHARLQGGHIVPDRPALIDEFQTWMDRYLGPVEQ